MTVGGIFFLLLPQLLFADDGCPKIFFFPLGASPFPRRKYECQSTFSRRGRPISSRKSRVASFPRLSFSSSETRRKHGVDPAQLKKYPAIGYPATTHDRSYLEHQHPQLRRLLLRKHLPSFFEQGSIGSTSRTTDLLKDTAKSKARCVEFSEFAWVIMIGMKTTATLRRTSMKPCTFFSTAVKTPAVLRLGEGAWVVNCRHWLTPAVLMEDESS